MPRGYFLNPPFYNHKLWRLFVVFSLLVTTICAGSEHQDSNPAPGQKFLDPRERAKVLEELYVLLPSERPKMCEGKKLLENFIPPSDTCNQLGVADYVFYNANIVSLCKRPEEAVKYLESVQKSCPQLAACYLITLIDTVESVENSRLYDSDIVENGNLCIGPKQSKPAWLEQPFFEELIKTHHEAQKRILILKRKATKTPRLILGVPMLAIGAGLLGGAIPLAYFAETRMQLPQPWPTSCTSPLGVANDPCIGDFRSSYIPMMAGGLALTIGGGLVIGMGHEWFYKGHPADSQPSGSGGKTP